MTNDSVGTTFRLLVCGSRDGLDRNLFGLVMRGFLHKYGDDLQIIEGGARGVDAMAKEFGRQFGLTVHSFPADWDAYSGSEKWRAGHERNERMLNEGKPDMVVGFKDGLHPTLAKGGTEHMLRIAKQAGVPTMVVGSGPDITS